MRLFLVAVAIWMVATPSVAFPPDASLRPAARIKERAAMTTPVSPRNAAFQEWVQGFRARAMSQGISPQVLEGAFRNALYLSDVIARDRNQAEFTKQIWEYLDGAVSVKRVENGRNALREHGEVLAEIEARYGVEAEVFTAIWGLESAYGEFRGDIRVIPALATLAFDGRRGRFFEEQLVAALQIIQSGDTDPDRMTGSWAGAMGHTQFIPTSYLAYAEDFRGDGRRDIWSDDPTDALASTAAYLARFGWQKGQPWGIEVRLPDGFDYSEAGDETRKPVDAWLADGVRDVLDDPIADHGEASILLPAGARGAAFMIFNNFHVISRYNAADAYVIGVGHLSDRIAGGPEIQADWPTQDRSLKFSERKEMQERLTNRGFNTSGADGIIGPNTTRAIRTFQKSVGMVPDGYASFEVLRRLR